MCPSVPSAQATLGNVITMPFASSNVANRRLGLFLLLNLVVLLLTESLSKLSMFRNIVGICVISHRILNTLTENQGDEAVELGGGTRRNDGFYLFIDDFLQLCVHRSQTDGLLQCQLVGKSTRFA
jgi:hypothetical protein